VCLDLCVCESQEPIGGFPLLFQPMTAHPYGYQLKKGQVAKILERKSKLRFGFAKVWTI
jgi:hypothetical protein